MRFQDSKSVAALLSDDSTSLLKCGREEEVVGESLVLLDALSLVGMEVHGRGNGDCLI